MIKNVSCDTKMKLIFKKNKESPVKYPSIVGKVSDLRSDGILIKDCGKNNIIACKIHNSDKLTILKKNNDTNKKYVEEYFLTNVEYL